MNIEIIDNKDLIEIWIDGEKWKEVYKKKYKGYLKDILKIGTKKELQDVFLNLDVKIARRIVYKLLSIKGYMTSELTEKLNLYKIDIKAIQLVLEECKKLGYLDDLKEGKLFVQRQKKRGWGPQLIRCKLRAKAPHLENLAEISKEEQLAMIKSWIDKKTQNQKLDDIKIKHKLYRFLKSKGFDDDLVRQLLFI